MVTKTRYMRYGVSCQRLGSRGAMSTVGVKVSGTGKPDSSSRRWQRLEEVRQRDASHPAARNG